MIFDIINDNLHFNLYIHLKQKEHRLVPDSCVLLYIVYLYVLYIYGWSLYGWLDGMSLYGWYSNFTYMRNTGSNNNAHKIISFNYDDNSYFIHISTNILYNCVHIACARIYIKTNTFCVLYI